MSDSTLIGHILVVDDDPALLQALPQALRLRLGGVRVDTFGSAEEALDAIGATDYDAVISDIKMPGMDGLTLLHRIAEARPDTPILLITGHGEHDLAIQALRGGAFDFIQKPIEREYLVASLGRAIQLRQLRRQVEDQRRALEIHAATLERAVAARTQELVRANEAKDTFLGLASHELRTPLTSIKALVQIVHRQLVASGAPEAALLDRVERSIRRLERLVADLVDATRVNADKLTLRAQEGDLAEVCRHAVEELEETSSRTITLVLAEGALPYRGDADRIGQVILNLLSNALKFSPPDAPVTLTVERCGGEAIISVRDQGPGISPEDLPHVFERFYQAGNSPTNAGPRIGLGLGLGLYISRQIVERHSGRIWAESTPGEGSTFYVALPLLSNNGVVVASRRRRHDAGDQ